MNPKTLIEAAFISDTTDGSFSADPSFIWSIVEFNFGAQIPDLSYFFTKITKFSFSGWNNLESKWRSKITRLVNWGNFVCQTSENNEFFFGKFYLLIFKVILVFKFNNNLNHFFGNQLTGSVEYWFQGKKPSWNCVRSAHGEIKCTLSVGYNNHNFTPRHKPISSFEEWFWYASFTRFSMH